jgi:hypothetical protein
MRFMGLKIPWFMGRRLLETFGYKEIDDSQLACNEFNPLTYGDQIV